jgi:hypothetical protein
MSNLLGKSTARSDRPWSSTVWQNRFDVIGIAGLSRPPLTPHCNKRLDQLSSIPGFPSLGGPVVNTAGLYDQTVHETAPPDSGGLAMETHAALPLGPGAYAVVLPRWTFSRGIWPFPSVRTLLRSVT